MVDDVEFSNVVHEMLTAETKFAINRCRGAFQECPGLWLVFGDVGMGMMEVGDGYDPVITHMYGITYNSMTASSPNFVLAYQSPRSVNPMPMSESKMRCHSSGRKSALVGRKWLFPEDTWMAGSCLPKFPASP